MTEANAALAQKCEAIVEKRIEEMRPTAEQIDAAGRDYKAAREAVEFAQDRLAEYEAAAIALVETWGTVPPHAEKSRRLAGKLSELTVTKAYTLTIVDERVETLKEALEANGYGAYFARLFTLRSKYEVVKDAEAALRTRACPSAWRRRCSICGVAASPQSPRSPA
jgi:tRNA U34 5-methylaminomethyl-2-thiouridine-forming methyltransferase MnmC